MDIDQLIDYLVRAVITLDHAHDGNFTDAQRGVAEAATAIRKKVAELEAAIKAAADAQEKWRQLWTASHQVDQRE